MPTDHEPEGGRVPMESSDGTEVWEGGEIFSDGDYSLVDLVNRVLDKGVVLTGDITLSVAGVDLVYLGLNAVLTSVSTARRSLGRPVGEEDDGTAAAE